MGATLNKATLSEVEIEIPDICEQQKAINIFDKMDELISCRKEQLAKLDELVKARFVEMFGDYKVNNKNFECYKGNELFKFSSGKFLPEEKRFNIGVPVYGGNGIAWYTEEALIDYPTIIIGRVGAQCGNIHTVMEPVWITDNAIFIKEYKIKKHTLEFLTELMKMMDFYQYADFSGQPKITQKPLENSNFIVPPIEEQKKFTAFVEQTEKTKAEVQKSLDELKILKKSLMQKYFG
jgi:type I restriction enzyme S subunit